MSVHPDAMELDLDGDVRLAVGSGPATPLSAGPYVARRDGGSWSLDGPA